MFQFHNPNLLKQAFIHRSYLNENRQEPLQSNERLEFLGDAVLEFWVSDLLFKRFPQFPEGSLTNLRSLIVCTDNLAKTADKIGLGKKLLLSRGEEKHGGRTNPSILADTFESFTGAIFLDQGWEAVDQFLTNNLGPSIDQISKQKNLKDPKSVFQEIAQAREGVTPNYRILAEFGPDHQKKFEAGVYINNRLIAKGKGNSKQKAEEKAAIQATKIFQNQV